VHKQILTSVVALPLLFACFEDTPSGDEETETAGDGDGDGDPTGDGDGDPTGDGDGDPTGDGDGDPTGDGDGDGDPTGDGDGDPTGDGDGEPVAECGNGVIEGDEVCDDGVDNNVLEPGACAPDCSTIIETKILKLSSSLFGPNFQPNPVAYADSRCEPGYKAMFAVGNNRVATTVPWQTVNSIDWPVKPYTAYVDSEGELVFITDHVALLGVRDGELEPALAPLWVCNQMFCLQFTVMLNGLNDDGTTANAGTCNGWTQFVDQVNFGYGSYTTLEPATNTYGCGVLDPEGNIIYLNFPRFLCVQQ
jgi:hypothetical protein